MNLKKFAGKVHLWLGLLSGAVVLVVGLTGCILVFEEEICTLLDYGVFQKVEKVNLPLAKPSQIFAVADSALAGKKIARTYYTIYPGEKRVSALWALDSTRKYHAVLQNPYTGAVVSNFDYQNAFFTLMTHIHISLGMGEVGQHMVSYATLIFVVLMITGIILWKPGSRKGYRQRFTIKWDAKPKRINYDLHNVPGFYMTWIAIFIAITGLVWSFEWMNNSVQFIANAGSETAPFEIPKSDTSNSNSHKVGFYKVADSLFVKIAQRSDYARAIRVYRPNGSTDALRVTVETTLGAGYARSDDFYYDQYTGKALATQLFSDQSNGEKIRRINYYIHVGSIGGFTGKLLAFFASLVAASLPVTGLVIFLGRKKSGRGPRKKMIHKQVV
ncbi:PepSY domain-containing protein [Dyadobacter luteus]|uniref:PepSY domain-containing protein n=1 Tax=Dyadobacter luteus TaxID=2259619 RepID=A0A3D8Y2M2_9BACT|nr:PepSY-associated TM helix domain-containing protein [Dyadobacter luteus]REA55711.1 PepSY domain-containing protein [Dyadobacter luteus]